MAEIHIPYLPSAKFIKIRCRLGIHEQDIASDTDSNPQIRTIGGTVTISTSVTRFRYTEADGRARVVYNKPETYNIQTATGELFDADGNLGVYLLDTTSPGVDPQGWTYMATIRPEGGEPFDAVIPSGWTGEAFDLGDGLVFTPSTGITDLETRVKALEDAQSGGTPGNDFTEAVQDIIGTMVVASGGTYNNGAGTITLPSVGGSSTIIADDTPAAPAEGETASYLVTSAVSWPAGLVWSTDPDGGVAPAITGTALVSFFTIDGVTRAILGATFPGVVVPDTTNPTAGTLAASAITPTGFTLTASGAADAGGLHAQPYAFDEGSGTFGAWQASASKAVTGKVAETAYVCRHKVRDAAGNESTGSSITVTTTAAPAPAGSLADAILALNPVGYWKLNEASGTQATDYSGNARHGTYAGILSQAGQDGFVKFNGEAARVLVPADAAWGVTTSAVGWSAFALLNPTGDEGDHHVVSVADAYSWPNEYEQRLRIADWGISLVATMAGFEGGDLNAQSSPSRAGSWSAIGWTFSHPDPDIEMKIMENGETTKSKALTMGDYTPTVLPLSIGAMYGPGYTCKNAMGHVAVFPFVLTEAQFAGLVAAAQADGLIP